MVASTALEASGKGTAQRPVFFLSFLLNPVGDFPLTPTPHVALGKRTVIASQDAKQKDWAYYHGLSFLLQQFCFQMLVKSTRL